MSHVVSIRLPDDQAERLERQAQRMHQPASEAARVLLDEALRQIEFPHIEFRDTSAGRQAYIKSRRVQVWMAVSVAQLYGFDVAKTAQHFEWPEEWVESALRYAKAFPDEIRDAIEDNDSIEVPD